MRSLFVVEGEAEEMEGAERGTGREGLQRAGCPHRTDVCSGRH